MESFLQSLTLLLESLRGLERIRYHRHGDGSQTKCPHGGAWWGDNSFIKMHPIGKRVPANVGTNACHHCLFHAETEWDHVKCRFTHASQGAVDRLIKRALDRASNTK